MKTYAEDPLSIYWYGSQKKTGAYSSINYQLVQYLQRRGHTVRGGIDIEHLQDFDYLINHELVGLFMDIKIPRIKHAIAYRTWDFGPYPPRWAEKINNEYSQLWVYASSVKAEAIKSGVAEDKVKVVPGGIEQRVFNTDTPSNFKLPTKKNFRFLFIGAAVHRKGIDKLLSAYEQAFSPSDDVSLVIKDLTKQDFYRDLHEKQAILEFSRKKNNPELIYIDEYFNPEDLVALIRQCHFGVFPYRAEGFALPILELMACGVPSIVPNFGPTRDYCSVESSLFVEYLQIDLPLKKELTYNSFGHTEMISGINICEVKIDDLAEKMRVAYQMEQTEYQRLASAGIESAKSYSWDIIGDRVLKLLFDLKYEK